MRVVKGVESGSTLIGNGDATWTDQAALSCCQQPQPWRH